eukprot:2866169-Prymnesium_polylepis.1
MPWTATDPQDHVGGCAPQPKRNVTPVRRHGSHATGRGRPKRESVNRMRATQLIRSHSASQLLLAGRKGRN